MTDSSGSAAAPSAKARFLGVNPHFVVPDVVRASEYYRDVLGFTIHGVFFEPPLFAIVGRDGVVIQFGRVDDGEVIAPNRKRREEALDAYVWVDDVDALHAELKAKGAKILEGPVLRFYKCYELVVEDLNGYVLVFARDTASD
jgi:catechol 2,3-dioxygenase-like lactoylglutathione lyase family enzyme